VNSAGQRTPETIQELDLLISKPSDQAIAAVHACPGGFIVLGAGGKMGLHVCQMLQRALRLLGRTDHVFAVSRFGAAGATEPFSASGIETIAADLSEASAYASLPPAANVIFLAGMKFGTAASPELLQRMNIDLPRLVAEHFRDSRIVALSTGCVYAFATPQSGGSTEQSALDPPGDYARSCVGRERAFMLGSDVHATPCVLVRLNYAVELRYGVLVDIARRVHAGLPVSVQTGYVNVIWQGDAVAQIISCLPLATTPPLIINVTGSEILKVRELAKQFAERFRKPVLIQDTEAPTAWLSNNARSVELFGPPPTSTQSVIHWIADWIDADGELLDKPTHFENRDGKY
jgi:nucleoside-diphosphate-sugar epimerase